MRLLQGLQYPNWTITVNHNVEYGEQILSGLVSDGVAKWVIFGREHAPTTGHYHLQGYVQFVKRKRRTECLKILDNDYAHWEPARENASTNFEYCTKEGDYVEFGQRPEFENAGQREQKRWHAAKDAAIQGTWEDMDPQILVSHYRNLRAINSDFRTPPPIQEDHGEALKECFKWYYGEPGCGKTRHCHDVAQALGARLYHKSHNKWWDGYMAGDVVLLDDVNVDAKWLGDFIKLWCQEYPFQAETKGGMQTIRPKFVWFTSNYHPHRVFDDPAIRASIDRRIMVEFLGRDTTYQYQPPGPSAPTFVPPAPAHTVEFTPVRAPKAAPVAPGAPARPAIGQGDRAECPTPIPVRPKLVRTLTMMPPPSQPVDMIDLTGDDGDDAEVEEA